MIRLVPWNQRQPGDIILVQGAAPLSAAIEKVEGGQGFVPSHVAIAGWTQALVVEAWIDQYRNSVASVGLAERYDHLPTQVWRLPLRDASAALDSFYRSYSHIMYGVTNLVGFLIQDLFHLSHNPIEHGFVCSQGGIIFAQLGWIDNRPAWLAAMNIRDIRPDTVMKVFQSHANDA